MSDPKLKEAMAEIKGILKKHDIGAQVTLVSETHAEFFYEISPSWSVAYFEHGNLLRLRAKRADFKTLEEQKRCVNSTIHMVHQIRDISAQSFSNMLDLTDMLGKQFEIDHTPYADFEPHREN